MKSSFILAALVGMCGLLSGCGYHRFRLRPDGEFPRELGTMDVVTLSVGERIHAIEKRGDPASWGLLPGLISSDPNVVRVEYGGGASYDGNVWLVGVGVGEAQVALGNAWIRDTETWKDLAEAGYFDPKRDSFVVRVQPAVPAR